jgi:hypothetical protein
MKQMLWVAAVVLSWTAAQAVDVNPSRPDPVKDKQTEGKGAMFQRNKDAAKRIQRANSINFSDIESKVDLKPSTVSVQANADGEAPSFRPTITFRNKGKRTYTFEFSTSQRYDIQIKNAAGQVVYTWSDDKEFVPALTNIMLNAGDAATLPTMTELNILRLADFSVQATPGVYTVEILVANYPEISGKALLTITP